MAAIASRLATSCNDGIGFPSAVTIVTLLLILSNVSTGFLISSTPYTAVSRDNPLRSHPRPRPQHLQTATHMSKTTDDDDDEGAENDHPIHYNDFDQDDLNQDEKYDDDDDEREPALCSDARGRPAGVVLEDLSWRVEKLRLEEANKRRFLKSGPRFLPYNECRKWVQAWGNRWTSAEEWNEWIESGEKRNSYIPSRPVEYFTRTGHWISWEHFLGVPETEKDSESG